MGLETVNPTDQPDVLNNSWPLMDDVINQGDDHIRNIKVTLKNFWTLFGTTKTTIEGYFEGGKAKGSLDADKLNGQEPSYYIDPANLTGIIAPERIQAASLTQVGAVQLSSTLSEAEDVAATPKLVKEVADGAQGGIGESDLIGWTNVPVANDTKKVFPAELVQMLTDGDDVQIRFLYVKDSWFHSDEVFAIQALSALKSVYQNQHTDDGTNHWIVSIDKLNAAENFIETNAAISPRPVVKELSFRRAKYKV